MINFDEMPNIGKVGRRKLLDAGIHTPAELIELGSKNAFLRLKSKDIDVCLHMLYDLEGAVQGIRKCYLSDEVKTELKTFYNSLK
jgi:DNA transformation protein and related proteins